MSSDKKPHIKIWRHHTFMLSDEAYNKLRGMAKNISELSLCLEKIIMEAKK
jgi:hypothetical protein